MTSRRAGKRQQRPDLGERRPRRFTPQSASTSVTRNSVALETASDAPATPAECDVDVQSIAAGGDGVARVDNRVIFIPRAAPGDRARILATSVRGGRFARGVLLDLLRPSSERVTPSCVHYVRDQCGGCQLQHVRYESQLEAKGAIVRDALVRIAHRATGTVVVEASPEQWRYRRKLTLALRRGGAYGRDWIAGLRRIDAPDSVFPLADCLITSEGVLDVWRAIMRAAVFLPDALSLRGSVRVTARGYAFHLEGGTRWEHGHELQAAVPGLAELWWTPEHGTRRRAGLPDHAANAGTRTGASFTQINASVGAALHADVVDRAMAHAPRKVIDAYAGTGGTAIALAERGVAVVAIEADRAASAECASAMPRGSRAVAARVEDALPRALPADVVILNPPRTGASAPVIAALRDASPPPRAIVYVSCDPATLARDVGRLAGWRIAALRSFDMFPQTAHVETVCELVPEGGAREGADMGGQT
jgi:23S rRNA (uracil1939-C5)-methyltransferase